VLHGRTKIAGFRQKSYKTLRPEARKTTMFQREINDMSVVQAELLRSRRTLCNHHAQAIKRLRVRILNQHPNPFMPG
jgi:hypothetical protein